ncbi:glycosyltransferase [Paenibacillus sp. sgz302251]|uniref:glycosyltransferase family 2 protein n=1 Tax=Paenibacillus sp. sgz302251 TaxID=3414493 RepID=UPI003C7E171E
MLYKLFQQLVDVALYIFLTYSFIIILFYFTIFIVSALYLKRRISLNDAVIYEDVLTSVNTRPLSIIVPAYNEEVGVVNSVKSLLSLNYPQFEIIVVNDGSKDQTLDMIIQQFQMEPVPLFIRKRLDTQQIQAIYKSRIYDHLFLIDKLNGGKADALNAGINMSQYPYFCSIDGDSILERDSLLKVMKPIIDSNDEVVVTGGSVRIANDCTIERGEVMQITLSKRPLVIMQIIEYLRAFLIGRIGMSRFNLLLIVSGAFGVFNKEYVIKAGGYRVNTVGEDMELVVRLHRYLKEHKEDKRIEYIPDSVCWTEAPESLKVLRRQRSRWHRGLFESLSLHKRMLLNPKYGSIGIVSMPYFFFVELLAPVIELLGYFVVVFGTLFDMIHITVTLLLFTLMLFIGSFLSMSAVLLEEWSLRRYPKVRDMFYLFIYALSESFWYRPMTVFWRIEGLVQVARKQTAWGEMTRKGISS